VTLDEVLERAGALPVVGFERSQQEEFAARQLEAKWAVLPRFDVTSVLAPVPTIRADVENPESNDTSDVDLLTEIFGDTNPYLKVDLRVTQPITTFGKIDLARELAAVGVDSAAIEVEKAQLEARFHAFRAYRAAQWYVEVDALLREAEGRLRRARERLEEEVDVGVPTARTDLRKLIISMPRFAGLRAKADEVGLAARSAVQVGLGSTEPFRVEAFPEAVALEGIPSVDAVLAYALEHRPDARLLDTAVAARDLEADIGWRALAPDLFAGGTLSLAWAPSVTPDLSGPFVYDPFNKFGIGFFVGLKWDPDLFRRIAQGRRLDAQTRTVRLQREAGLQGIRIDVDAAYREALGKARVADSYREAYRAADAWLKQVWFQFDQGLAEYSDIEDPLKQYYETAGARLQAILEFEIALADLALKCGAEQMDVWPHRAAGAE
jgi:outer membrane protein TolC